MYTELIIQVTDLCECCFSRIFCCCHTYIVCASDRIKSESLPHPVDSIPSQCNNALCRTPKTHEIIEKNKNKKIKAERNETKIFEVEIVGLGLLLLSYQTCTQHIHSIRLRGGFLRFSWFALLCCAVINSSSCALAF